MRIKLSRVLLLLNLLSAAVILLVFFLPSPVPGLILGVPFLIFGPGFALMAAFSPSRAAMDNTERIVLSLAISIAVTPLIGLILNYTEWGITAASVVGGVSLFTFVVSVIAWLRLGFMEPHERDLLVLKFSLGGRGVGTADGILTAVMVIAVIGTLAAAAYFAAAPKGTEQFTQFYLAGANARPASYSQNLALGETGEASLSIVNHEGRAMEYRIGVYVGGAQANEIGPVFLLDGEEWTGDAEFSPVAPGEDQEVEFMLFKNGDTEPYLEPLYIWVDVFATGMVGGSQ